jgi:hypothetical protein
MALSDGSRGESRRSVSPVLFARASSSACLAVPESPNEISLIHALTGRHSARAIALRDGVARRARSSKISLFLDMRRGWDKIA